MNRAPLRLDPVRRTQILLVLGVVALHPRLVLGTAYGFGDDCLEYAVPFARFVRDELSAGRLPLWNPFQDGGAPLLAQPPWMGPLYPGALLFLLPAGRALDLGFLLHVVSFALGTAALARTLGLSALAAAWAALAAAGGTPMRFEVRMGYLPEAVALSYLPWLLLVVTRGLARGARPWPWVAAAGSLLGLVHLGGHLVAGGVTLVATGIYALAIGATRAIATSRLRPLGAALAFLVAAEAVGLLLAAPQWLPLVDAGLESSLRHGRDVAAEEYAYLEEGWRLGGPVFARFDATGKGHLHVGSLLLAFVPMAGRRASGGRAARARAPVVGLAVLGIGTWVLAWGNATPLWAALRAALPPMRIFSYFYFFLAPVGLAVALLGALGFDRWRARLDDPSESGQARRRDATVIGAAMLGLVVLGLATLALAARPGDARALARPYLAASLPWATGALAVGGLAVWSARRTPEVRRRRRAVHAVVAIGLLEIALHGAVSPRMPELQGQRPPQPFSVERYFDRTALIDALPAPGVGRVARVERVWYAAGWALKRNEGLVQRFEDVELASKLPYARAVALASRLEQIELDWTSALSESKTPPAPDATLVLGVGSRDVRVLDVLGVHALVTDVPVSGDAFVRTVREGGVRLHRRTQPPPRVFGAASYDRVVDLDAALTAVLDPARDPWLRPVVEGEWIEAEAPADAARVASAPRVDAVRWEPGHVEVDVTARDGGLVVLGEMARRGWRVSVDGSRVPTAIANGVLLAAHVPAGAHRIEARYRPRSVAIGLGLAAFGVLLVVPGVRRVLAGRGEAPWHAGTPLWF